MKLKAGHIKALRHLDKQVFQDIIEPIQKPDVRSLFLAQSDRYQEGDEKVLPYPERSSRGIWLTSMSQNITKSQLAVVMAPSILGTAVHVKSKFQKLYTGTRIYKSKRAELWAALYAQSSHQLTPYDFWRQGSPEEYMVKGVPGKALIALDPPPKFFNSDDFKVTGAYLKPVENMERLVAKMEESALQPKLQDHFLEEIRMLARAGLTKVQTLGRGLWIHSDH